MVGGGSTINDIRCGFERNPPIQYIRGFRPVPDLGIPNDLRELPAIAGRTGAVFNGTPTFLLTAYGLSFETDDLPDITLPVDVAPFCPSGRVRQFLGHEDLGYEKG
jgi:hypothetical protein